MSAAYRTFFGLTQEPFRSDLTLKEIHETPELLAIGERFDYALRLGAVSLVTGEIGSGKSTALRYLAAKLHPAEYRTICLTASSGSILEFYRFLLYALNIERSSSSRAVMLRLIKKEIQEMVCGKKLKLLLIIDEANLMRLDVFAELHTLVQFEQDSKPWLPIILAGQSNLIDKLMYRTSMPLASRIVGRSHPDGIDRQAMENYLQHHLSLAGMKQSPFDQSAITAIHQGSGGIFRKANHLARGALISAAAEKALGVTAEHVRMAATEIF